MENKVVVLPIGNAGNITAVMRGFLKFYETGIIDTLPKIIGVQSEHANPVYRYYLEPDPKETKICSPYRKIECRPGRHDRQPGFNAKGDSPGGSV